MNHELSIAFRSLLHQRLITEAAALAFFAVTTLVPFLIVAVTFSLLFFNTNEVILFFLEIIFRSQIGTEAGMAIVELATKVSPDRVSVSLLSVVSLAVSLFSSYQFFSRIPRLVRVVADSTVQAPAPGSLSDAVRGFLVTMGLLGVNVVGPLVSVQTVTLLSLNQELVPLGARVLGIGLSFLLLWWLYHGAQVPKNHSHSIAVGALVAAICLGVLDTALFVYASYATALAVLGPASFIMIFLLWVFTSTYVIGYGAVLRSRLH